MKTHLQKLLRPALLAALLAAGPAAPGAETYQMQMLQSASEQYVKAMEVCDASVAAQKKAALDGYLLVLDLARKRETAAGRSAVAAAIDAETAAVKAGPVADKPAAQFPADLGTYRDRFIAGMKRAETSNDSVRKHATDQHLKWLAGLESVAKGKDEDLVKAIVAERARVQGPPPAPAPR